MGNACGALVVARHGCTPAMPTKVELEHFMARSPGIERPDLDSEIEYLHRVGTRRKAPQQLFVLAFDQRREFEEIASGIESNTIRLTMAQALVRYLLAQKSSLNNREQAMFAGVFAIFGHGNVAGLGEALEGSRDRLPVYRAHNEQAMAHAAIAFAKATRRRRITACTTSIGPGATNLVTAAAVAHLNRLPVLLLPGDTFASRLPDPVLQQVEDFSDPTVTANDCLKPVSRYWDRITRPEQLMQSLPQAISVLTDPVACGPVTLALPQDVQAQAFDYPESFFASRLWRQLRPPPDHAQLQSAVELIAASKRPLIVCGGGVHYSAACSTLAAFAGRHRIPVAETQAGKGALPWDHPCNVGAIGVTGSSAANTLARDADLVIAIGTRLQDFTTGSGFLVGRAGCRLLSINVARHDLAKRGATPLQSDARSALERIEQCLGALAEKADGIDALKAALERLRELARRTLDAGVLLSVHHHMGTVVQSAQDIDRLMETTGDAVGLLLDTGHAAYAGADPATIAQNYGSRIAHVHLKDVRPTVLQHSLNGDSSFLAAVLNGVFTVPGDGCVDFETVLSALGKADYEGWLVVEAEQDPSVAPPAQYATSGYQNLKSMLGYSGRSRGS